ncbi:hypothetical protein SAMN05443287_11492 [Micromonospora phaseoli]|uniref:Methyltransferase domain-containing protein n=1 Tax=Micromonospora phaseoli TaxID=1144548 RepID=A0A1H7DIK8_9ACTN|nr:hypothetical protein [Micromonospora phaseoli]PZW02373.1 hypothetical protein CLV64_102748 [Micromonospora phaseoli]GIJ75625.1 hypothetical protein Xph01_00570 [Micromonospora phaseoli]SEK01629.1 hypothetical protein SAMN05443287_11492 [Micromonospora phaseoli]
MSPGTPVRLLGDEMHAWSDLDGAHGPGPVRGTGLAALLTGAYGRTLVVGPHHPELLDTLPPADLTVLVRGLPDAEALAARYADRPGVRVCCGGPERLTTGPAYDTVVALDGLARLNSVEGAELTWGEAFELLVSVLRPGGRLLLGVENHIGLHRLLALPAGSTDSDWAALGEYDDTRPAGLARLRDRLAAAGLRIGGTWAAFPSPRAPVALLGTELLADADLTGFLQAALAVVEPARLGPVDPEPVLPGPVDPEPVLPGLADPERLAGAAIRNGAALELAPGWVLLAERRPDHGTVPVGHDTWAPAAGATPAAAVLVQEGRVRQVHPDQAGGWRFADGGAVPSGRTVEDLVVAASLRRDLPAVRALLTAWQSGVEAGVPADRLVVTPTGDWHGLAAATEPVAALRRLASRLVDAGLADLWPAGELAATLAVTAGQRPGPLVGDGDDGRVRGWRELTVDRDRLARELTEARALQRWYERTLTERDDELKRLRRIVSLLHGTPTARAGRLLLAAVRTARSAVRRPTP